MTFTNDKLDGVVKRSLLFLIAIFWISHYIQVQRREPHYPIMFTICSIAY